MKTQNSAPATKGSNTESKNAVKNANTTRRVVVTRDEYAVVYDHAVSLVVAYALGQSPEKPREGFAFGPIANGNHTRNYENESTNAAKQQVKNRKNGNAPAPQAQDAPVPANVEDVQRRYEDVKSLLSKAKKDKQKHSDKVATLKERFDNESYALATLRCNMGTGDEQDAAIVANRKVEIGLNDLLGRAIGALPQDSDEVAKARLSAKAEERSLTSAIAETKRQWSSTYRTLYGTIGLTKVSMLTPDLLKGLCPFLMVGTADGLKAGVISRSAVRKNGKAVKQNGKRVYKYTLRERKGWSAYGLFELLELNFRWFQLQVFTADELQVRSDLLNAQVSALKALKEAKAATKSDVPEQAAHAAEAEAQLAAAAKAAGKAVKESTATVGSKTAADPKATKVA